MVALWLNMWEMGIIMLFAFSFRNVEARCPNSCNGHGFCNANSQCECYDTHTGGDCSLRRCPKHEAWVGIGTATDNIHSVEVECSGVGACDRATGFCVCDPAFEGMACERMMCNNNCNGHGDCISLEEAAQLNDGLGTFYSTTYNLWDAKRIMGCVCEPGYTGYDCSLQTCTTGDDPTTTGQADEVQKLDVCGTGGTYKLKFRGQTTVAIARDAANSVVKSALEGITTIDQVTVTSSTTGNEIVYAVTFNSESGDLPVLAVVENSVTGFTMGVVNLVVEATDGKWKATFAGTSTSDLDFDADAATVQTAIRLLPGLSSATVALTTSGNARTYAVTLTGYAGDGSEAFTLGNGSPALTSAVGSPLVVTVVTAHCNGVYTSQTSAGTKEDAICNNRGACSSSTGVCTCHTGFSSSNGLGTNTQGTEGDCGYTASGATACPGTTPCSGNGICESNNLCTCKDGFTGLDCSERVCPYAQAWFDEPTATNIAHALAECSNRGICDRTTGVCTCQAGFTGAACQRKTCPVANSLTCNGRGSCHSLRQLGAARMVDGVSSPITYGATRGDANTWDADRLFGCKCDNDIDTTNFYNYRGHACTDLACPTGDDPMSTGQSNEVQTIRCKATGGSFKLTYKAKQTEAIDFDAIGHGYFTPLTGTFSATFGANTIDTTADQSTVLAANDILQLTTSDGTDSRNYTVTAVSSSQITVSEWVGHQTQTLMTAWKIEKSVQTRLEALQNIRVVGVSMTNTVGGAQATAACSLTGTDIRIEFRRNFGDLPMLGLDSSQLTSSGSVELTIVETVKGTKEEEECSLRGVCDATTGLCKCASGYQSSDGEGNEGKRGDCGAAIQYWRIYPSMSR